MTEFIDGPAAACPQALMLQRAPHFLRVVFRPAGGPLLKGMELMPGTPGKWDALDQPNDTPDPEEMLFAYQVDGEVGTCHITAAKGRGGFYAFAKYRVVKDQPSEEIMRSKKRWREWCIQNAPPLGQY